MRAFFEDRISNAKYDSDGHFQHSQGSHGQGYLKLSIKGFVNIGCPTLMSKMMVLRLVVLLFLSM